MEIVDGEDRLMFGVTDKENPGKCFAGEMPTHTGTIWSSVNGWSD